MQLQLARWNGAFAINPIKGIADLTVSRFMFKNDGTVAGDSKAWYLADDSKPWFVVQMREAMTVVQGVLNSGASFNQDVVGSKPAAVSTLTSLIRALHSRQQWQRRIVTFSY